MELYYDLSIRALTDNAGNILPSFRPSLVFGDRPTWGIRIMDAGQPADLSGVAAWTAAVAEDLNPGTRPMCRTVSGISEAEGFVSVPLDAQTDTFAGATANRGPRVCLFELAGLDGDGGVALRVAFHAVCRMEADPGAVGDLVPIETTEMTSAQVQAVARGAAREEVAEIQEEIGQAAESAANSAETASGAASSASESAEAAQRAASTVPSPEGANPGDVPTVQEDGSVAYQPQQGGAGRWGAITGDIDDQTDLANALGGINAKIPQAATAQNQLVTAAQMGDAISSVEARQLYATSAQGSFATKAALTSAATFYLANGEATTPTKNDVAYVLADESHEGKAAKYVLASETGAALVWGFVITFSGTSFTQAQQDAIDSGITAGKVAKIDSAVQGARIPGGSLMTVTDGILSIPRSSETAYGVMGRVKASNGIYQSGEWTIVATASTAQIDARNSDTRVIKPSSFPYAVRSVSPLITAIPEDALTPTVLTDASSTINNHSYIYVHAPSTAPTYQLPAVSDATITHEIVLYLDLTTVASFAFQDSAGATVAVDTNGVTPALGEKWTVWAEYLHGAWIVRGMKDKEASA